MPSAAVFLARNLCGICTRMPAPSPARGSAPTAPRCSKLTRMVKASATILCDLRPLMSAINPTPQESFSSAGSNRPKPDASIVVLAILPEPRPTRPQGPDAATVKLLSRHRPHAEDGTKRACAQGRATLSGGNLCAAGSGRSGCLFCRPARPRHRRPTRRLPPPEPRRRAVGSPNWDSNAVLYRTWQIPQPNTSARPFLALSACASRRRGTNRRYEGPGHRDFCEHSAAQLDHGMAFGAMGDDGVIAAIRATFAAMNFASDNTAGI